MLFFNAHVSETTLLANTLAIPSPVAGSPGQMMLDVSSIDETTFAYTYRIKCVYIYIVCARICHKFNIRL